ncbi:MAG: hypothetical protein ACRER1_04850 [Gammaproteobacteria bacterium]
MTNTIALAWSGGKDSFMALEALEARDDVHVAALLTTLTDPYRRICMHGVRETLLDAQASALGLPLAKARLPENADNDSYRECFSAALAPLIENGVTGVAFGDLFLADVRGFREAQMQALGLDALFPLWGTATDALAARFIVSGQRAILCCVDGEQLDPAFLGRAFDAELLADLPPGADPCGENGEFHTFVHAGPRFAHSIAFRPGRREVRDGRFHFLDLV